MYNLTRTVNKTSVVQMLHSLNDSLYELNNPIQWLWDLRIGREWLVSSPVFPVLISVFTYFICCSLFMSIDFLCRDSWFARRYKIQKNAHVTWPMVRRAVRHTVLNNVLLVLPATIAQLIWVPPSPLPSVAPTIWQMAWESMLMLVIFDFQYWVWHAAHHRSRWLYRHFHAIHHQYHSTFSWTTQYLHPWELFTVGWFTTLDGWVLASHPLTEWAFMLTNILVSVEAHSGLDLPIGLAHILPFGVYGGAAKHDMHHMRPRTNFQPFFSTWDRLAGWHCPPLKCGSDEAVKKWQSQPQHSHIGKLATEMMRGQENGLLEPNLSDDEDKPKTD